ncbi:MULTISPECIES: ABC transporter permease [Rufibacter]|uniref:Putative ABC transport system permease protein n=1 Tax=Rufibacter quisquiliarum TaxID=1549639 RepID=A0A839GMH5_9BACT|nr:MULTISPECIES: FtsX-like permease family protein [Rufibacter]MBA9076166.1 putative ABC transport system permease protein [Rufibacter quisquiliarum]
MIRHLFKLIWNRKKSNFLLITEMFFSFMVLFAVISFVLYNYHNYKKPLGIHYQNVWQLSFRSNADSMGQAKAIQEQMMQRIKSFPEVEAASLTHNNVPFAFSSWSMGVSYGNKESVQTNNYEVQDAYKDVFQLSVDQGRWFGPQDAAALHPSVVINQVLKDRLFGEGEALGKQIKVDDSTSFTVVGVMPHYRADSEFAEEEPALFQRINLEKAKPDQLYSSLLIKVKPGTGVVFEEKMVKDLSRIAKDWTIEVTTLEKMRQSKSKLTWVPMVAMGVVCGFLIFNVALGLFGVLWYNINRRYSEIGLRRALGATTKQIRNQFVGEVLVMATFGLLLGLLLAAQFPLLHVFQLSTEIYWQGIAAAALLIFLLATVCAVYPSWQAAKIHPAVALHEE